MEHFLFRAKFVEAASRYMAGRALVAIVVGLITVAGLGGGAEIAAAERDALVAKRIATPPKIDGKLDDEVWETHAFASGFVQREPNFGDAARSPTRVAIAFDEASLYIAADLQAPEGGIRTNVTRRDQFGATDWFAVSLDGFANGASAYSFAVTAAGVQVDWYHPDDSDEDRDYSYDPVWTAKTHTEGKRWTAEIRIPLSQVRFRSASEWKMNFVRFVPKTEETLVWTLIPKDESLWQSQFDNVGGLKPENRFRMELVPFVSVAQTVSDSAADSFKADPVFRGGADLKLGIGAGLTLDATVLPDFGQLEADPTVLNLSQFEVFFEERRPFFIEGAELLAGTGKNYYYSRRIGAPPAVCDDGSFAGCPNESTILGATKLTGRLSETTSIGAQVAVSDKETALDSTGESVDVAPLSTFALGRLQRGYGSYGSHVGLSTTGVFRDQGANDLSAQILATRAFGGGLDWRHRFGDGDYELRGDIGGTRLEGEEAAIDGIMRGPVHLFQRPDQDHVSTEAGKTSLSGFAGSVALSKRSGTWQYALGADVESPGFDPNDAGQLQSADNVILYGGIIYNDVDEGRLVRQSRTVVAPALAYNFGGVMDPGAHTVASTLTLRNFWQLRLAGNLFTPGRRDTATRGGMLMGVGWGGDLSASLESSESGRHGWSLSFTGTEQDVGDSGLRAAASGRLQLADRLSFVLTGEYQRSTDNRQFVENRSPQETLFGTIERQELSARLSFQFAITPTLSMDATTQPFAATGRFTGFGLLNESGSRSLEPTTVADNLDFGLLSLRSNVVLRWEYQPGSTALLVWSQNHSGGSGTGDGLRSFLEDRPALLGNNILLFKMSYWFSP